MSRRFDLSPYSLGLLLLSAAGCTGNLTGGSVPTGGTDGGQWMLPDGSVGRDGGVGIDGGNADAGSTDAGVRDGGIDAGPLDAGIDAGPCASVMCSETERCDEATGSCICREGYVDVGGSCTLADPGDPATRTIEAVCAQWNAGRMVDASTQWTDDGMECGTGSMPRAAIDDTLRRINMFRWLAGLPNVTDNPEEHEAQMQCAMMMSVNRALDHSPPESWTCHTSAGAGSAGRSNLALGARSSADSIDLYMRDRRVPSLGHRRWILSRGLGRVGIGYSEKGGRSGQCLSVFDFGGSSPRTWTSYPNPGPAPVFVAEDEWSFQGYAVGLRRESSARVVRISDGMEMPVMTEVMFGGGQPDIVKIVRDGWSVSAGDRYRITITGLSGGDITYETHLIDC